ncbi:MAG: trypsin-like peptidase domain-containing protein [Candidatus Kerfeldbacteria bacterium]|nr:trypsin-like peptidase domain-containing protein [Candidatus Kerfeldbacteria bacterium]
MSIKFEKFEEQVFLNTVLIENLTDGEFGTGFLVQKKVDDTKVKHLLFSNKHVFWGKKDKDNKTASKKIRITFHKKENDGSYRLGNVNKAEINIYRGEDYYYEHPEQQTDVACINVSNAYNLFPVGMRSLELDKFIDFNFTDIFAGQRIIFVGYPKGFFDDLNFLPVARCGSIASIPAVDFRGKKQLLIDAQVFPGSSGSPVFVQLGIAYKLLGILSDVPIKPLDFLEAEVDKAKITEKKMKK